MADIENNSLTEEQIRARIEGNFADGYSSDPLTGIKFPHTNVADTMMVDAISSEAPKLKEVPVQPFVKNAIEQKGGTEGLEKYKAMNADEFIKENYRQKSEQSLGSSIMGWIENKLFDNKELDEQNEKLKEKRQKRKELGPIVSDVSKEESERRQFINNLNNATSMNDLMFQSPMSYSRFIEDANELSDNLYMMYAGTGSEEEMDRAYGYIADSLMSSLLGKDRFEVYQNREAYKQAFMGKDVSNQEFMSALVNSYKSEDVNRQIALNMKAYDRTGDKKYLNAIELLEIENAKLQDYTSRNILAKGLINTAPVFAQQMRDAPAIIVSMIGASALSAMVPGAGAVGAGALLARIATRANLVRTAYGMATIYNAIDHCYAVESGLLSYELMKTADENGNTVSDEERRRASRLGGLLISLEEFFTPNPLAYSSLNKLEFQRLLKKGITATALGIGKNIAIGAFGESLEEFVQSFTGDVMKKIAKDNSGVISEDSLADWLGNATNAFAEAFFPSLVLGGAGVGLDISTQILSHAMSDTHFEENVQNYAREAFVNASQAEGTKQNYLRQARQYQNVQNSSQVMPIEAIEGYDKKIGKERVEALKQKYGERTDLPLINVTWDDKTKTLKVNEGDAESKDVAEYLHSVKRVAAMGVNRFSEKTTASADAISLTALGRSGIAREDNSFTFDNEEALGDFSRVLEENGINLEESDDGSTFKYTAKDGETFSFRVDTEEEKKQREADSKMRNQTYKDFMKQNEAFVTDMTNQIVEASHGSVTRTDAQKVATLLAMLDKNIRDQIMSKVKDGKLFKSSDDILKESGFSKGSKEYKKLAKNLSMGRAFTRLHNGNYEIGFNGDKSGITMKTPLHEITHVIFEEFPEYRQTLLDAMKEIFNDSEQVKQLAEFYNNYSEILKTKGLMDNGQYKYAVNGVDDIKNIFDGATADMFGGNNPQGIAIEEFFARVGEIVFAEPTNRLIDELPKPLQAIMKEIAKVFRFLYKKLFGFDYSAPFALERAMYSPFIEGSKWKLTPTIDKNGRIVYQDTDQNFTSKGTSVIHQIPTGYTDKGLKSVRNFVKKTFNKDFFKEGSINFEQGAGQSLDASRVLRGIGVKNVPTDYSWYSKKHNEDMAEKYQGKCDTATAMNVINVIDGQIAREILVANAGLAIKKDGVALFQVYKKNGDGVGQKTGGNKYQNNMKASDHIETVKKYFDDVAVQGDYIIAQNPKYDAINSLIGDKMQLGGSDTTSEVLTNGKNEMPEEFVRYQEDVAEDYPSFIETEEKLKANPANFDSEGNHLAPNGEKSNLTYRQWVQVRTPEFKKWFGDWENDPKNASKVVDENGEPRVVYHGTTHKFERFDPNKVGSNFDNVDYDYNFYFTASEANAKGYGKAIPVFLNIRNPEITTVEMGAFSEIDDESIHEVVIEAHDFGTKEATHNDTYYKGGADGAIFTVVIPDKEETQKANDERNAKWEEFYNKTRGEREQLKEKERALVNEINKFIKEKSKAYMKSIGWSDDDSDMLGEEVFIQREKDGTLAEILNSDDLDKYLNMRKEYNDVSSRLFKLTHYVPDTDFDHITKYELHSADIFMLNNPVDIKSAVDNNGDFSTTDDRFRYSEDEWVEELASPDIEDVIIDMKSELNNNTNGIPEIEGFETMAITDRMKEDIKNKQYVPQKELEKYINKSPEFKKELDRLKEMSEIISLPGDGASEIIKTAKESNNLKQFKQKFLKSIGVDAIFNDDGEVVNWSVVGGSQPDVKTKRKLTKMVDTYNDMAERLYNYANTMTPKMYADLIVDLLCPKKVTADTKANMLSFKAIIQPRRVLRENNGNTRVYGLEVKNYLLSPLLNRVKEDTSMRTVKEISNKIRDMLTGGQKWQVIDELLSMDIDMGKKHSSNVYSGIGVDNLEQTQKMLRTGRYTDEFINELNEKLIDDEDMNTKDKQKNLRAYIKEIAESNKYLKANMRSVIDTLCEMLGNQEHPKYNMVELSKLMHEYLSDIYSSEEILNMFDKIEGEGFKRDLAEIYRINFLLKQTMTAEEEKYYREKGVTEQRRELTDAEREELVEKNKNLVYKLYRDAIDEHIRLSDKAMTDWFFNNGGGKDAEAYSEFYAIIREGIRRQWDLSKQLNQKMTKEEQMRLEFDAKMTAIKCKLLSERIKRRYENIDHKEFVQMLREYYNDRILVRDLKQKIKTLLHGWNSNIYDSMVIGDAFIYLGKYITNNKNLVVNPDKGDVLEEAMRFGQKSELDPTAEEVELNVVVKDTDPDDFAEYGLDIAEMCFIKGLTYKASRHTLDLGKMPENISEKLPYELVYMIESGDVAYKELESDELLALYQAILKIKRDAKYSLATKKAWRDAERQRRAIEMLDVYADNLEFDFENGTITNLTNEQKERIRIDMKHDKDDATVTLEEMTKHLLKHPYLIIPEEASKRSKLKKNLDALNFAIAKPVRVMEFMDASIGSDVMEKLIYRPISEAYEKFIKQRDESYKEARDAFEEILKQFFGRDANLEWFDSEFGANQNGGTVKDRIKNMKLNLANGGNLELTDMNGNVLPTFTGWNILGVYVNSKNTINFKHLITEGGNRLSLETVARINPEDTLRFINLAIKDREELGLTKNGGYRDNLANIETDRLRYVKNLIDTGNLAPIFNENSKMKESTFRAFGDKMIELVSKNFKEIVKLNYKLGNTLVVAQENYFPLMTSETNILKVLQQNQKGYVGHSFTLERCPNAQYALDLNPLEVFYTALDSQAKFLNMAETMTEVEWNLSKNGGNLSRLMQNTFGADYSSYVEKFVSRIAGNEVQTLLDMERCYNKLISNIARSRLVFNPSVSAKQFISAIGALVQGNLKMADLAYAMKHLHDDTSRELIETYGYMVFKSSYNDFAKLSEMLDIDYTNTHKFINFFVENGMKLTELIDGNVKKIVWLAKYRELLNDAIAKGQTESEKLRKDCAYRATQLVQKTQSVNDQVTLSSLEANKNPWVKMTFMFTRDLFNTWNMVSWGIPAEMKKGNKEGAIRIISSVLLSAIAMALLSGLNGTDNDKKENESSAHYWLVRRLGRSVMPQLAEDFIPIFGMAMKNFMTGFESSFWNGGKYIADIYDMATGESEASVLKLLDKIADLTIEGTGLAGLSSTEMLRIKKAFFPDGIDEEAERNFAKAFLNVLYPKLGEVLPDND